MGVQVYVYCFHLCRHSYESGFVCARVCETACFVYVVPASICGSVTYIFTGMNCCIHTKLKIKEKKKKRKELNTTRHEESKKGNSSQNPAPFSTEQGKEPKEPRTHCKSVNQTL